MILLGKFKAPSPHHRTARKVRLPGLLLGVLLLAVTGCSWRDKNGTSHTVVVGFGIVSTVDQPGVCAQDCKALGVVVGRSGVNAGLVQTHRVSIDPNEATNAIIQVHSTPLSLTVKNFDPYSSSPTKKPKPRKL